MSSSAWIDAEQCKSSGRRIEAAHKRITGRRCTPVQLGECNNDNTDRRMSRLLSKSPACKCDVSKFYWGNKIFRGVQILFQEKVGRGPGVQIYRYIASLSKFIPHCRSQVYHCCTDQQMFMLHVTCSLWKELFMHQLESHDSLQESYSHRVLYQGAY